MAETYLFDGADIQGITGVWIGGWDGQFTVPDLRGDDPAYPGINGVTPTKRPFGTSVFTIPLEVVTDNLAARNDALNALLELIKPGQVTTCTRRRTLGTGDVDYTANVRYLSGFDPGFIVTEAARLAVSFTNLDGTWTGNTLTVGLTNGVNVENISGTAPTQRMTITLTGGTASTLTNAGYKLVYSGTGGGDVVIDTTAGTATQGSTDVSQYLSWTGSVPFALMPNTNHITLSSGGTASIDYDAAYV